MQLTSGSEAAILNNDYQPTSDNVGSVTGESGICANEGMALKSCHWPLPVLVATILNVVFSQSRAMLIYPSRTWSKKLALQQLKSCRYLKPFKSLFHFHFNL